MGALTRVAVPRLLTGDASGLDGCQLRGLASAMAARCATARRGQDTVALDQPLTVSDGDGWADHEAALLITEFRAERASTLLTDGWFHYVVSRGLLSIRMRDAVRVCTPAAAAEPGQPSPTMIGRAAGRPSGRPPIDTCRQEAAVLDWMCRDGRPTHEFKNEELIKRLEEEFSGGKRLPHRSTLRRRALQIIDKHRQIKSQNTPALPGMSRP